MRWCWLVVAAAACCADEIEIVRDTWGVPHVFAATEADAFYGLGWCQAADRGFQMQLKLRVMQGRVAELLGDGQRLGRRDTILDHDRQMRVLGWAERAEEAVALLPEDERALLDAYCAGVNAWFAGRALPETWQAVGLEPQPWTPARCLLAWWHMARFFGPDGTRDLNAERALARGIAVRTFQEDSVAVVGRDDVTDAWLERVEALLTRPVPADTGEGPRFSHAWALSAARSADGAAVLVSDPRTPVSDPPLFHEFHLSAGALDVRGIGTPGCPLVLIGFNRHVAWGATALGADQADLFRLRTAEDRPGQYFYDGAWRDFAVRAETLVVKGRPGLPLEVLETVHGPVMTPYVFATPEDGAFALRRVPLDGGGPPTFSAGLGMMRATDADSFLAALRRWRFPSMNCVFADAAGIGYSVAGALPIRNGPRGGRIPLDGSVPGGWRGFIPGELLPFARDPERGVLFSANHRPVAGFYRPYIGHMTGSQGETSRSWRLRELLAGDAVLDLEQVLAIQRDTVNPGRRDTARIGGAMLRAGLLEGAAAEAAAHLEGWLAAGAPSDLRVPGAALALEIPTGFRRGGISLVGEYGGGESGLARCMKALCKRLEEDEPEWSRLEVAFFSSRLSTAWEGARRRYGEDTGSWERKALEATAGRFGWQVGLDRIPAPLPIPQPTKPALWNPDGQTLLSQPGQTYTQVVPLGDVDAALSLMPIGPSEDPAQPWRDVSVRAWVAGELHPAPLSRDAVLEHAARRETIGR